jgi:hypothetical protein
MSALITTMIIVRRSELSSISCFRFFRKEIGTITGTGAGSLGLIDDFFPIPSNLFFLSANSECSFLTIVTSTQVFKMKKSM